jgi:hypothetical protein
VVASLALSIACAGPLDRVRTPARDPAAPPAAPSPPPGRVEVFSDPRVDLGYALVALAHEGDLIVDDDAPLTRAAREELAVFRTHPAVLRVASLRDSGLWVYPLVHALLAYTPPPELAPRGEIPADVLVRLPGASRAERLEALESWIAQVREFAGRTRFEQFLARHEPERQAQVDAVREALGDLQAVALIESYCGGRAFDRYLVHPSAFARAQFGYGPSLATDSERIAFHLAGRAATQERFEIMHLMLHELGHSFVHPALDAHSDEVARRESEFDLVAASMGAFYPSWRIALGEEMVEAVTARLVRDLFGPAEAERVLVLADEERGYAHVEPLARALRDYERQRDRYPSLESFVPAALRALDRASGRPRLYGGADGIDRTRAEAMVRRVVRAARRGDKTLLEDHVVQGLMRGSLLYEITNVLPRELGLEAADDVDARVRTVRRVRGGLQGDSPMTHRDTLVVTAHVRAAEGRGERYAVLRLTLLQDPPGLLAAGWEVQTRSATNR